MLATKIEYGCWPNMAVSYLILDFSAAAQRTASQGQSELVRMG